MPPHDEEEEPERCRYCDKRVLMMCRQMTGFCSELCEERFYE